MTPRFSAKFGLGQANAGLILLESAIEQLTKDPKSASEGHPLHAARGLISQLEELKESILPILEEQNT